MKMKLLKATTYQRKKGLKAQSPLLLKYKAVGAIPGCHTRVILETSPRNQPGQGSARPVHPHYTLS